MIPLNDDDAFDKFLRQANKEFVESTAVPLDVDDALATVDGDDAFDKWLHRANKEFVESTAVPLDVDDALATVKRRAAAHELQRAASDGQLVATHNHIHAVALSLSAAPRTTRSTTCYVRSNFLTSKLLAAVSTITVGIVVFFTALLTDSHSPFSEISALDTSTTAQTSSKLEPDPDGGKPVSAARSASPVRQPTLSTRQPGPPPPGNQPLQPSAPGAPSASGHPTQSGKPRTDSPETQKEQRVELSAQNSVEIEGWRQVNDKSGDLQMDQHGIYTVRGAKLSIINDSAAPTYDRCAQIQSWSTRVDFTALQEGSHLCAQSSGGRYAMLRVAALPSSQESHGRFIFHGRTWQCARAAGVRSAPSTTTPGSARPSTATQPPNESCDN